MNGGDMHYYCSAHTQVHAPTYIGEIHFLLNLLKPLCGRANMSPL